MPELHLRLPADLHGALKARAEAESRSLSNYVGMILKEVVTPNQPPVPTPPANPVPAPKPPIQAELEALFAEGDESGDTEQSWPTD